MAYYLEYSEVCVMKSALRLAWLGLVVVNTGCDASESSTPADVSHAGTGNVNGSIVGSGGASTNVSSSGGTTHSNAATGGLANTLSPNTGGFGATATGGTKSTSAGNQSLAGDRQLGSLSAAEIDQLNQAIADDAARQYQALSKDQLCLFAGTMGAVMAAAFGTGATDATIQQSCTQMVSTCQQGGTTSPNDSTSSNEPTAASLAGCTVTVSEYETCAKDSATAMVTAINALPPCSQLTAASLTSTTDSPFATKDPTSCAVVNQKCPQLMSSG